MAERVTAKTVGAPGHSERMGKNRGYRPRLDTEKVKAFQKEGQPVIFVDTKKKELVGNYENEGREWQPKGQPEKVRVP